MKLATIAFESKTVPALLDGERVLRLDELAPSLQSIIEGGEAMLSSVREFVAQSTAKDWLPTNLVRFAPPVPRPGKFVCVGLNYRDHAEEGGHPIPDYPALFLRTSTSLAAHNQAIVRPRISSKLDYEAELAVVIGKTCKRVDEAAAETCVFGYTIFNDISLRDFQKKSTQWTAGKNFDGTGPLGPAVVTADEVPPRAEGLAISCAVNGEVLQDSNTNDMIFSVPRIISLLSEFMTLEPGDHIAMGTPAGVGFARTPPIWLKAGDKVEVTIAKLGTLSNTIIDEEIGK